MLVSLSSLIMKVVQALCHPTNTMSDGGAGGEKKVKKIADDSNGQLL